MMVLIFGTLAAVQTKLATSAFAQSQNVVCPTKDVQHWDKIVFFILTPDLAKKVNLPVNSELGIKVLDDPHKVADIKQKVLTFLEVTNEPRSSIQIVNVEYSIICNSPNSNTSQYSGSTSTAVPPNNPPPPCPDGQPQDANGNCPDTCPDGSPMPKGGVAECPHPPRPDTCPDGSPMPKGGVAECPHPPSPDTCPDGSPMPKGGVAECPHPPSPDTCPDGSPMPKGGVAECPHPPSPDTCPDGSPMPKGGVAECPHPPSPDTCPDGSPMPKGGVAECPHPCVPAKDPNHCCPTSTDQDPNSGDCIPLPKSPPTSTSETASSPTPKDNCGDPIFANANEDRCTEPGTMVSQVIEHDIGQRK